VHRARLSRVRRVLGAYSRDGVVARRPIRPRGRVEFDSIHHDSFRSRRARVGIARSARAGAVRARRRAPSRRVAIRRARRASRCVGHRDAASNRIVATTETADAPAMRASAGADDAGGRAADATSREERATREIAFRNYVPRDGALAAAKLPATTAPALDVAAARDGDEGAVTLGLEPNVGDVDPGMVAPRRANWDLKRDVEARLERLERRTRRALVDVAREEARARAAMDA